jgi:alpha-tubulin suppressor-like RCC1 family protein
MGDGAPIVDLGKGASPVQLALGSRHSCALLMDGRVKCWGANELGQLGAGDTEQRGDDEGEMGDNLRFVDLGDGAVATAVSAGSDHTCALLAEGAVKCWGANDFGQLGLGDTSARGDAPDEMGNRLSNALPDGSTAVALASGSFHTCVVLSDGAVQCWGLNEAGQLGIGDDEPRGDAEPWPPIPPFSIDLGTDLAPRLIAAGAGHSCAALEDGSLKCWGINLSGTLGIGQTMYTEPGAFDHRGDGVGELGDALPFVALGSDESGPLEVRALSAGLDFTCAVLESSAIKCWGVNDSGQLGIGNTDARGVTASEMGNALREVSFE